MIRVNDQESLAVVIHQWCDVQSGKAELYLNLNAPISEAGIWMLGQRMNIEARWNPHSISYPSHDGLKRILISNSVKGSFVVEGIEILDEGRLAVRLKSASPLQPLTSER